MFEQKIIFERSTRYYENITVFVAVNIYHLLMYRKIVLAIKTLWRCPNRSALLHDFGVCFFFNLHILNAQNFIYLYNAWTEVFSVVPFLLLIVLFFLFFTINTCIFFFSFQNFLRIRIIAIIKEYSINIDMEVRVLSKTSYRLVLYICFFYEIAYQKDKICDIYTYLT